MIHDIALVPEETIYKYLLLIYVNLLQHHAGVQFFRDRLDVFYLTKYYDSYFSKLIIKKNWTVVLFQL